MYVKKIHFERTGGFAGIRLAAEIEVNELPDDQKHEILELLDEMDFDELPEKPGNKMPIPDEFFYSVTVESDSREYKVSGGESSLPQDMAPLLDILGSITKQKMRERK
ncbi:MAG TPA: protealysin inhibitor emfourin [Anaerolineales bacterium]|nr:protealysin inhibitor emfourin [Anaerolineales bacterium]